MIRPYFFSRRLPVIAGALTLAALPALALGHEHRHAKFPIDIAEARAAADAAFTALDADGDGVVSRNEFLEAADLQGIWPGHGKRLHGLHRMHGRGDAEPRAEARGQWRERRDAMDEALFERLDVDGDGRLSADEFGSEEIRQARSEIKRERLFERLDRSGSGTLSRDEFGWWVDRLEAMDADGDGVVTHEEAQTHRRARSGAAS
jgi:Ca2+-binding EF-hand superfamily protein